MEDDMRSPLEWSHIFPKHVIPLASVICSSRHLKPGYVLIIQLKHFPSIIQYEQEQHRVSHVTHCNTDFTLIIYFM